MAEYSVEYFLDIFKNTLFKVDQSSDYVTGQDIESQIRVFALQDAAFIRGMVHHPSTSIDKAKEVFSYYSKIQPWHVIINQESGLKASPVEMALRNCSKGSASLETIAQYVESIRDDLKSYGAGDLSIKVPMDDKGKDWLFLKKGGPLSGRVRLQYFCFVLVLMRKAHQGLNDLQKDAVKNGAMNTKRLNQLQLINDVVNQINAQVLKLSPEMLEKVKKYSGESAPYVSYGQMLEQYYKTFKDAINDFSKSDPKVKGVIHSTSPKPASRGGRPTFYY